MSDITEKEEIMKENKFNHGTEVLDYTDKKHRQSAIAPVKKTLKGVKPWATASVTQKVYVHIKFPHDPLAS